MELGVIVGFVLGFIFIVFSIFLNGNNQISAVISFIDPASIMITVGGTLCSTLIATPMPKLVNALLAVKHIVMPRKVDPTDAIRKIIELANLARKEGILALEDAASNMEDMFLQKGVMLVVDGTDPDLVRNILETELMYVEGRHKDVQGVWEYIASQGPAWGMIGTLIGLVMMLQNMSDPSTIGASMAVAIITTFYGSLVANFVATPIATKMKVFSGEEILMKEVLIEGMLSVQAGENPRIIEEKLKAFLSPALRESYSQKDESAKHEREE